MKHLGSDPAGPVFGSPANPCGAANRGRATDRNRTDVAALRIRNPATESRRIFVQRALP